MQRAEWNRTVTPTVERIPLKNNVIKWDWKYQRRYDEPEMDGEKTTLFNVAALRDAVWGGETEWRAGTGRVAAEENPWRKEPAFFNVELLHDAVWEGY